MKKIEVKSISTNRDQEFRNLCEKVCSELKNNKISDEDTFLVFNIFNQFEIVDSYCAPEKIVKLDNNTHQLEIEFVSSYNIKSIDLKDLTDDEFFNFSAGIVTDFLMKKVEIPAERFKRSYKPNLSELKKLSKEVENSLKELNKLYRRRVGHEVQSSIVALNFANYNMVTDRLLDSDYNLTTKIKASLRKIKLQLKFIFTNCFWLLFGTAWKGSEFY